MALITLPFVFSPSTTIISSQVNSVNTTIFNDYNGNINDSNISPAAAINYTKLALNNTIKSTDILSATVFALANIPTLSYVNITPSPYIKVSEVQSSGTGAGNGTGTTWTTRVLNTKDFDTASIGSLSGNQLTLPGGTYQVRCSVPFVDVTGQARLQNITASTTLLLGQSLVNNNTTFSQIVGQITLASSSAVAVQYWINNSAPNGLGSPASTGTSEVYTIAEFTKVA